MKKNSIFKIYKIKIRLKIIFLFSYFSRQRVLRLSDWFSRPFEICCKFPRFKNPQRSYFVYISAVRQRRLRIQTSPPTILLQSLPKSIEIDIILHSSFVNHTRHFLYPSNRFLLVKLNFKILRCLFLKPNVLNLIRVSQ